MTSNLTLIHGDCLTELTKLPDNSIDLIVTDPPYFQVKPDAWDNQWPDVESFLAWLDSVSAELWRVLKPAGTLYLFCGPKLAADTELLLRSRFNVLNHIVWAKPSGPWNRTRKSELRSYFRATERIIMCEHYGAEGFAKGSSGYYEKCKALRQHVFAPLIDYFKEEKARAGVSNKEINQATGTQMASHWFTASQWQLPNAEQYQKLQALFTKKALERDYDTLETEFVALQRQYQGLAQEFDDLKAQYQHLRRPFTVSKDVPFTDVWHYPAVPYYPGKHPCEKPAAMLEHIINASSRPGDIVLDCFMGSGSTGKACMALGRHFIGIELDDGIFNQVRAAME